LSQERAPTACEKGEVKAPRKKKKRKAVNAIATIRKKKCHTSRKKGAIARTQRDKLGGKEGGGERLIIYSILK